MSFDKLLSYQENSLPYPRNIILTELIDILTRIAQPETIEQIEDFIKESSPDSIYDDMVTFINRKLQINLCFKFYVHITSFVDEILYLEESLDNKTLFTQEMDRAFGIKI